MLGSAALIAVLLAAPRHRGPQPAVVTRGGLIEVEYTTASTDLQRAAGRRCGLDAVADLSPTHIRYAVTPGQERRAGDCLQRQGIVRTVAFLG